MLLPKHTLQDVSQVTPGIYSRVPQCSTECQQKRCKSQELECDIAGSGRSFTAYVFSKASFAQQAQRDPLSDVTVAQPVSPQPLGARRAVAESPSPVSSAAVDESCSVSKKAQAGTAVITVHAHCTAAMNIPTDKQRASTVLPHGAQKTHVAKAGKSRAWLAAHWCLTWFVSCMQLVN